jgi:outer membrane protein OmpA-like peptidoglycan-associated protein
MLLLASALTACSTQSERGSTGTESQAAAPAPPPPAPAPEPEYVPQREPVQYSEAPLPETPPPPTPVEEFPITQYELPPEEPEAPVVAEAEPVEEEDEFLEEEPIAEEEMLDEEEEVAAEEPAEELVAEAVPEEEDEFLEEEPVAEEEMLDEEEEEVALEEPAPEVVAEAPEEEEEFPEEEVVAEEEPEEEEEMVAAAPEPQVEEEEHVVEDLGPLGDTGQTLSYAEEKTAQRGTGASAPQEFPDEPTTVTVTFEADPLFNFDKYNIRSDQRSKLDELVDQLNGATYSNVSVAGHADRIGTDAYNLKLSERRANSVKAYLVRKGIPASKITIEFYGEGQPITSEADCQGKRGKDLISCYQPDRRVEVNVTGEKTN